MRWTRTVLRAVTAGVYFAVAALATGQAASPNAPHAAQGGESSPVSAASSPAKAVAGGRIHGVVRSGNIPLPGVTVTAQNTLTGKRYSTTTDITGAWSLTILQNGRYVIHTEFAAFAQGAEEALLNQAGRDRTVNFELILASRAAAQEQQSQAGQSADTNPVAQAIRELTGNGAENLSLMSALGNDIDTGAGTAGASGAELPSIAGNSDFGSDSVNINGQSGQVSPLAGVDVDRIRDATEEVRARGGQPGGEGGLFGGGPMGGGMLSGGPMMGMGGPGGFGGRGGGGGGRGNFRGFNSAQPHGAVFWQGTNSAVNAEPFALVGQAQQQPSNGTNRFGLTFMSEPYIPRLTKPSGKDTIFLTLAGQRSSTPDDFYATVPTLAERQGDFSSPIYNPATGQPYPWNGDYYAIPPAQFQSLPAYALMTCPSAQPNCQPAIPLPNLSGAETAEGYNYHLLTTGQTNTTQAGVRYMRSIGPNAGLGGFGRFGGFGRRNSQNQGLRQSINFNYNYSRTAQDDINMFPQFGGKTSSGSNSVQAGYTVGYHRFTSISNVSWNRSNGQTTNFFTNSADNIAFANGILAPNQVPLNYGLPNLNISNLPQGFAETQPSFSTNQTLSFSETLSWIHGKHNMRYGGDYRRVHRDFLAGSDATGNFSFTGFFTEDAAKDPATGSAVADFVLGYPASTSINSTQNKSYLRDNVFDAYAMDDWRVLPYLTVNYGVRYEFFAPYTEEYGRLAMVDSDPAAGFSSEQEVSAGGVGPVSGLHFPDSLVYPWHKAFAPRVGLALRVPKVNQMVVRAGFGMNYTVGEYATFANTMAHEPAFTDEQTNSIVNAGSQVVGACAQTNPPTCFSNGFPTPATVGNYALDPHYGLPYVQTWNLDVQKTLPWGIVMNVGYNGSKANHLDVKSSPQVLPESPLTNPTGLVFNYDQALAFYKMSAGTVRVNKRLTKSVAMGANYQYAHGIDDATSVNGSSGTVAQDWLNLAAEEGNSSAVVRHLVSGTYLYELPFGEGRAWATSGVSNRILEGFSISGSYTLASGTWLSPTYTISTIGLSCGTAGSFRANVNPGVSAVLGGRQWINPAAYSKPVHTAGYCDAFGDAPRNSIEGPGTVTNNMALSKTVQMGDTRSMEIRASMNNAFNTVQYKGVNTSVGTTNFGQVTSAGAMRSFQFMARFRF